MSWSVDLWLWGGELLALYRALSLTMEARLFRQQRPIDLQRLLGDVRPAIGQLHPLDLGAGLLLADRIGDLCHYRRGERIDIAKRKVILRRQAKFPVRGDIAGEHREAGRHGLQERDRHPLMARRQDEERGIGEEFGKPVAGLETSQDDA